MCAPPDSGLIHMVIAASTLLDRGHDLRQFECNVTQQAAQVTQNTTALRALSENLEMPLAHQTNSKLLLSSINDQPSPKHLTVVFSMSRLQLCIS